MSSFIAPCLPSPAERPPVGPGWLLEIKHDGYRMMASRDAARRSPAHPQRPRLGAQRFPMAVCDQSPHRRLKNLMEHFF
jgi:hypothetical protein